MLLAKSQNYHRGKILCASQMLSRVSKESENTLNLNGAVDDNTTPMQWVSRGRAKSFLRFKQTEQFGEVTVNPTQHMYSYSLCITRTEYFLHKVLMMCKRYFTNIQCTSFLFVSKYMTFSQCTFSCILCLFDCFVQTYWSIKLCRVFSCAPESGRPYN